MHASEFVSKDTIVLFKRLLSFPIVAEDVLGPFLFSFSAVESSRLARNLQNYRPSKIL